jgi:hypothetical protein
MISQERKQIIEWLRGKEKQLLKDAVRRGDLDRLIGVYADLADELESGAPH